jgi:hypothetical protein
MAYSAAGPAARANDWSESVRSAVRSEERLSAWAALAVWVYAVAQVTNTAVTVATLPAVVTYVRQILNNYGTLTPPQQPAAFRVASSLEAPLILVAGIVFLLWQYRAAKAARALGYPGRRSPALGAWSWVIPVVNFWFPYQAIRDLLPPGHEVRTLVLRTWLCYVFTIVAVIAAYLTAFASSGAGQAIGCLAIAGWIAVGTGAYRVARAVAADHAAAAGRY